MALGLAQSWAQCLNQGFLDTGQQQFLQCSLVPIKGSESKANLSPRLSPSSRGERSWDINETDHTCSQVNTGGTEATEFYIPAMERGRNIEKTLRNK